MIQNIPPPGETVLMRDTISLPAQNMAANPVKRAHRLAVVLNLWKAARCTSACAASAGHGHNYLDLLSRFFR